MIYIIKWSHRAIATLNLRVAIFFFLVCWVFFFFSVVSGKQQQPCDVTQQNEDKHRIDSRNQSMLFLGNRQFFILSTKSNSFCAKCKRGILRVGTVKMPVCIDKCMTVWFHCTSYLSDKMVPKTEISKTNTTWIYRNQIHQWKFPASDRFRNVQNVYRTQTATTSTQHVEVDSIENRHRFWNKGRLTSAKETTLHEVGASRSWL